MIRFNRRQRTKGMLFLAAALALPVMGLTCLGNIQREISVLYAPENDPLLLRDSVLVDLFGMDFIRPLFR